MDGEPDAIPDFLVRRKWRETSAHIEQLNDLTSFDANAFPIDPDSTLAADDRASSPFRVSVVLRSCINAGIDHLHALKSLVDDAGLLHVAAPFSLARGGLENLATATWILAGATQGQQVERTLRWHAQNAKDGDRAMGDLKLAGARTLSEQRALLDEVAQRCDVGASFHSGYASTEAVKAAEAAFPELRLGVLRPLAAVLRLRTRPPVGIPWGESPTGVGRRRPRHDDPSTELRPDDGPFPHACRDGTGPSSSAFACRTCPRQLIKARDRAARLTEHPDCLGHAG